MNTVWLWWAGLAVGSFAILETWALLTKQEGDTLSERLREWLGIRPVKHWRLATSAALLGFLAWFGWHIVFG
ncbi:hypothetical protein Skr01_26990 [Sphaerisporangium krabiense]|uniref:Uncharacterized protein n=1 Tax=Sphaerisporangium krabiense TaxID=763782 RepID=A0A7W8ZB44_9ACTN|nr:hypothetical protein [Sphaerisporangium krabiense]MBB5630433.1 hypothetical protein [Sphaerisporangium krabiense]GII62614.1 hypothetical protein Skr01_26990 [Sphaerisporangium krabiense]